MDCLKQLVLLAASYVEIKHRFEFPFLTPAVLTVSTSLVLVPKLPHMTVKVLVFGYQFLLLRKLSVI